MLKAIYPGSFDPITLGHLDIISRASKIYDVVYVALMVNPNKKYSFPLEERKAMIEKCIKDYSNVEVIIGEGLTVDLANKLGCKAMIRGIRATSDYESELSLATANMTLNSEIETLLFIAKPELSFLSSSIAKEIASYGRDISSIIPEPIIKDVEKRFLNK